MSSSSGILAMGALLALTLPWSDESVGRGGEGKGRRVDSFLGVTNTVLATKHLQA